MKQKTSKNIRTILPKNRRFHRFFLRRLLICMLAAAIGGAVFLQIRYKKDAGQYRVDTADMWRDKIEEYSKSKDGTQTEAERLIEKYGVQGFTNHLASYHDLIVGAGPSVFTEGAAMLIDPENLTYYISEPEICMVGVDNTQDDEDQKKNQYYPDTELSEQIGEELQDYVRSHYLRFSVLEEGFYTLNMILNSAALDNWLDKKMESPVPFRITLDGDHICRMDYAWVNGYNQYSELHSCGTEPEDGCRVLLNPHYIAQDGKYIYADAEFPNEEYLREVIACTGYPSDCESGRAVRKAAEFMEDSKDMYQRSVNHLQEIIQDPTGKLREEYDRASSENSQSPEEGLEDLYYKFGMLPSYEKGHSMGVGSPFSRYEPFYTFGDLPIEIDGRTWYIFYCEHYNWLLYVYPLIIIIGSLLFAALLILSLIWAVIAYFRFKHKYEMAEYRRNLTSSLAHDLKSPLMAISSFSENLFNDVQPEKRKHYEKAILDNTQYMDSIIVNVLELSATEKNMKIKRNVIDLTELAGELLASVQEQLDTHGLKASVSGKCIVKADREMMMQAIRNLLDNAFKYTPEGGSITITGQKHTLSIVNDIAEEQIADPQRLSKAFVKGDKARSNRMGTGLGLSIVQQIAAQNKLRLHIESSMHQFRVRLKQNALISPLRLRKIKK